MTPAQQDLIRRSFAALDTDTAAAAFYRNLFARDSALRRLFPADLRAQQRKLMAMIALAVEHIDRVETLSPALMDLGRRHRAYGVAVRDYDTVAAALIDTLAHALGDDFTEDTRVAWETLYGHIAARMQSDTPLPA